MAVAASSKPKAKLSAWRVFRAALADYGHNWLRFSVLVGIIAVPATIINITANLSPDTAVAAYISLATLMMNVALVWAVSRPGFGQRGDWLGGTYYDSSKALVRFILVAIALALCLLPAVLGLAVYSQGMSGGLTTPALGEVVVITALAILVAFPSVWLLVRFGFSLISVVVEDARPSRALSASWRLSRRHFWRLLGQFILGLVFIALILVVPSGILLGLAAITHQAILSVLWQIFVTLTLLPLFNIYLYQLYTNLGGKTLGSTANDTV